MLLLALYFARRPLFESWIAGKISATLADQLQADVEIGSVEGNWLTSIHLKGIRISGKPGSAYRRV